MTSRSHLPSLSGNKLDYHPLPAGSPLLSLYDKCFPCFMTRSTASGSGMTGPRSGTRPPGGSWSTTTCKSWRKARQLENQRDANIPRSYPTLAERKIVTSTLDSSTPLLALNMRPVVSMLIISFNKSTTPLFQKKKKHNTVVNCPTRWSLSFIFVFLCWSSIFPIPDTKKYSTAMCYHAGRGGRLTSLDAS